MGYAVFFLVILLSNIIQGITGFAGTILAMPPSLMLVGYDTAKPVLNVLGLLSGIYVFAGHRKHVCWGELKKIVAVMAAEMCIRDSSGTRTRHQLRSRWKKYRVCFGKKQMCIRDSLSSILITNHKVRIFIYHRRIILNRPFIIPRLVTKQTAIEDSHHTVSYTHLVCHPS